MDRTSKSRILTAADIMLANARAKMKIDLARALASGWETDEKREEFAEMLNRWMKEGVEILTGELLALLTEEDND